MEDLLKAERLVLRPSREGSAARDVETGASTYDLCERTNGKVVGAVEYRVGVPGDGWLTIDLVAMEPALRGLGLESEAVRLVEEDAVERGLARRFRVSISHSDGPALYFWLRLGYSPARSGGEPWPWGAERGIMPMIRRLENPEPAT